MVNAFASQNQPAVFLRLHSACLSNWVGKPTRPDAPHAYRPEQLMVVVVFADMLNSTSLKNAIIMASESSLHLSPQKKNEKKNC